MSQLASSRDSAPEPAPNLHADGRFKIEGELGRGGMGAVYRAIDLGSGRPVALKRLSNKAKAKHVALFEREYHTLASLRHPQVVAVLDYGTDVEGPWYTMELLEGSDLAEAAPLPWTEVCRVLRDVASALALVHARRLLHRDISARNVWRTSEGRVKLIDFGALCAFGRAGDLTGTPPFIAPEALHGELLDQRTDLYSLGVLGYFLLTGLYPFPARELTDLDPLWLRSPKLPSERVRELCRSDLSEPPPELDALLDALLRRDPIARPGSASELIERLDAIVPPSGDTSEPLIEGSLGSAAFVGRAPITNGLKRALEAALEGRGSAAVIEAESGLGRSRLLTEFALAARLSGAVALQVDPAEHRGELYGIAYAFASKLLDLLPELARRRSRPHAPTLGHVSEQLRQKLGLSLSELAVMPEAPGEARMRIQAALVDWFADVAKERGLVLLADDLQAYDESSAAWLASLARLAKDAKLLVIGSVVIGGVDELERAVQSLRRSAAVFKLAPLSSAETLEMLRSIFGDTPRLARLAEALHRAGGGRPAHVMELVEHLVRTHVIGYSEGGWVLPHDPSAAELPSTRTDLLAARLARLTPEARALAETLSVIDGRIAMEAAKALARSDSASLFAALESLVQEGVLSGVEGGYTFCHDALRKLLGNALAPERRALAHRTLGELMLQAGTLSASDSLRAGVHLMVSGDLARGSDLACGSARELATTHMAELGVCTDGLEQALAILREHQRPLREQMAILAALTSAGLYVDRKLAMRYGSETLEAFERSVGLGLARRLRPFTGRKLSLLVGLASAALSIALHGKSQRCLTFRQSMLLLFNSVACLTGVYTICVDPRRAAACAQVIEPLSALGKGHVASLIHEFCVNLASTITDRLGESYARWQRLIARLQSDQPIRDLPDSLRLFYVAGGLYASGVMASWRDDPRALRIADELDALKLKLYEMSADQVRVMYYGNQGNRELFDHYRERVEMHAIQRGTAWQAETWAAAAQLTVYMRMYDGLRMKQCLEQLQRIAAEVPSLRSYVRRAHGIYTLLRGKPKEALPWLEDALEDEPLAVVGWARACGTLARAYNALGNHARARDLCQHTLQFLSAEDLTFPAMNATVLIELALAEAGLGRTAEAAQMIRDYLAQHGAGQGPLTLGALHEAGARIAITGRDEAAFDEHFAAMEHAYRGTKIASLIERCDRLAKKQGRGAAPGDDTARQAQELGAHLHTVLYRIRYGGSGSIVDRARWALSQVSPYVRLTEGYVYLVKADGVQRIAELATDLQGRSDNDTRPSLPSEELAELDAWVSRRLASREQQQTMTAAAEDPPSLHKLNELVMAGRRYRLIFLQTVEDLEDVVVGALVVPSEIADVIPHTVLEAVASRFRTLSTHSSEFS